MCKVVNYNDRVLSMPRRMMNKALGRNLKVREYEQYIWLSLLPCFEDLTSEEFLNLLAKENKYDIVMTVVRGYDNLLYQNKTIRFENEMLEKIFTYITKDPEVTRVISHYNVDKVKTLARLVHGLAKARPIDY